MKPPPVKYQRAGGREEAVALLSEHGYDAKLLAGGQSLVPLMSYRLVQPGVLIDLNPATDLNHVGEDNGHLVIGSMTRQRTVETSQVVRDRLPVLAEALGHVGHVTIRNRGTIGGSLAHADPAAELPVVLLALDGEVAAEGSGGARTIAAGDLFVGPMTTALEPTEIITSVRIPRPAAGTGAAIVELARRHGDFAIVIAMAAIHLDGNGRCDMARIALGGVEAAPARMSDAESAMVGAEPSDAVIEAAADASAEAVDPMGDIHASESYRRDMTRVFVKRALAQAVERAKGGAA